MKLGRLEAVMTQVSRIIALIGLAGLLVLAFATMLDVFLRWLFNAPITGVRDTYTLFLTVIIASCFPLCMAERSNITIRFLGNVLGARARKAFDLFGGVVTMIIFAVMVWKTWIYTNELQLNNETTWVLGWPVAPWWRVVTGLIIFAIPVLIIVFFVDVRSILSMKDAAGQKSSTE